MAEHALQMLASLPASADGRDGGLELQQAIGGALAAVIMNPRTFTMDYGNLHHALTLVMAASRDANVGQLALGGELGAMANALRGHEQEVSGAAIATVESHKLTKDQALMVLAGMVATGNSATQNAVHETIHYIESRPPDWPNRP